MTCNAQPDLEEALGEVALRARQDLEVSRHVFAGKVTYVLRDPITFESHRLSPMDYDIFVEISSGEPLTQVFDKLVAQTGLNVSAKSEFYQFVTNLLQLGLVGLPSPDGKALFSRAERRQQAMTSGMLKNFLFQQIPIFNPDRFLDATIHWVRFLFSKSFLTLWFIAFVAALSIVLRRWTEFMDPLADILTLRNIPLLWAVLFLLKIFHEFGHAYACKHFGGRVPAMGVYLIAGNPCAFVDASAAWGFPNRLHRIMVSLGGMYFESIIGIIGVFVWAFSNSAVTQSCAHHVVFMSTAVTLLFNANPLMKYDGYFVLCDLLGSPNLRQRSTNALNGLLKKCFLGIGDAPSNEAPPSQLRQLLLISYGIACSIYKFFVVISISTMVAGKFAVLGLAMAGYYIVSTVYGMYSSALKYLWASEEVRPVYRRARAFGVVLAASVPLLLLLPIPTAVRSTGRLTVENEIAITSEMPGTIRQVLRQAGDKVSDQDGLVLLENDELQYQLISDASRLKENQGRVAALSEIDRVRASMELQSTEFLTRNRDLSRHRVNALTVSAGHEGTIIQCLPLNQVGQFLPEGTTLAVVGSGKWLVRFVANAETILAAKPKVGQSVSMRLASQPGQQLSGKIARVAKMGDQKIEESLTQLAGGDIAVNPVTQEAAENYFEVSVEVEDFASAKLLPGQTVEVRMHRHLELVGQALYRRVTNFITRVMTG